MLSSPQRQSVPFIPSISKTYSLKVKLCVKQDSGLTLSGSSLGCAAVKWSEIFLTILKKRGPFVIGIFVFGAWLDQSVVKLMEQEMMNPEGAGPRLWMWAGASLGINLVYPLASLVVALSVFDEAANPRNIIRNIDFAFRESLRSFGKSLLWGFLLILPGLYKAMRYSLTSFVVCLDPAYHKGERDALKASEEMTGGVWPKILGLFVLFGVLIPLMGSSLSSYKSFENSASTAFALSALDAFFFVAWNTSLLLIFFKKMNKGENPHVAL